MNKKRLMILQATAITLSLLSILVNLSIQGLAFSEFVIAINGFFVVINGLFLIRNIVNERS